MSEHKISYVAKLPDGWYVNRTLGRTESLLSALRLNNAMDLGLICSDHYRDITVVPVKITIEEVTE